jgi:hypothetical protein
LIPAIELTNTIDPPGCSRGSAARATRKCARKLIENVRSHASLRGAFETAPITDADVDDDTVEPAHRCFGLRNDATACSFVRHVGDHDARAIALARNSLRCLTRRCGITIRARDSCSFTRTQHCDGASVTERRVGIVARLRAGAHHQNSAAGEATATRRATGRFRRRPDRRGIALAHVSSRSARRMS